MILSEASYVNGAKRLGCKVAAIKAVDSVESNGGGMINGRPVILFEPHIWWKELRKVGVNPNALTAAYGDMLYPVWNTYKYPAGQDAQHLRLQRAVNAGKGGMFEKQIRDSALKSCSWGRFQICGFNHAAVGCHTVQEFVNRIYKGEAEHLAMFVEYILHERLDDELREGDWKGFARAYNGPSYAKNRYDVKLAAAYKKFST